LYVVQFADLTIDDKGFAMRFSTRAVTCGTVVALAAILSFVRPCPAQGIEADAKKAAEEAAVEAEQVEQGKATAGPNPLAWDPDLAVCTLIVFLGLFAILAKFAWPQISAALDERERKIADDILAASQKHEDAKKLLADYEARLAAAAGEVRALLDEARRDAEHTKNAIVAEARKAAEGEKDRAVVEIGRARDAAVHELAERTANVAIELAKEVTQKDLSTERNNELIREAMNKLAAAQPSRN
jgi:F-type H+-transporting ATPase subunit b